MSDRRFHLLFVCVANSCRSQMAQAIGRALTAEYPQFDFDSAGGQPATRVDAGALAYLDSVGISAEGQYPKTLEEVLPLNDYDGIVLLCAEACVTLPKTQTPIHAWNLEDPTALAPEARGGAYAKTHELIESKLRLLLDQLIKNSR